MIKKIVSYLIKRSKRMPKKPYLYGKGLRKIFPHNTTPIIALDFIREIGAVFKVGITDVEILLLLNLEEYGMSRDKLIDQIFHAKDDHVKALLRKLIRKGLVHQMVRHDAVYVAISDEARGKIKSLHR